MNKPHSHLETGDFTPREAIAMHPVVDIPADTMPRCRDETDTHKAIGGLPSVPGYEVVREVGRGGMGVVFEAIELALNRPVAIKMLIAERFPTTEELIRFRLEAEVAARVSHPNVVRVYGSGAVGSQPYLALEWVAGGTLADAVGGKRLPPTTAAHLVAALARAVHAAHANGVIHRDLKPSNILLARADDRTHDTTASAAGVSLSIDGTATTVVPKVTDFGLAKLIVGTAGLTETGRVMGTPEYMAPEQAAGRNDAVGPATDVHALGVILYQLLTARTPFHGDSAVATLRRVTDDDPAAPRSLGVRVPRDLETICLKCLQKLPTKRYATAAELADDLDAQIDGRPILARQVGPIERVRLWAARRPAIAALTALVVLLVIGGFVGVSMAWYRAEAERRRAEAAERDARKSAATAEAAERDARKSAATAEAVNRFLVTEMLASAAPEKAQGRTLTVADVLREASLRVGAAFAGEPTVEAGVRFALGRSYRSLGQAADAEPHLKRAAAVRRDTLGPDHRDTLRAESEHALALDDLGRWADAEAALRRVAAAAETHFGPDDPTTLDLIGALALSLHTHGRTAEAEPLLAGVVATRDRVSGPTHSDTLRAINDLAVIYYSRGKLTEADRLLTAAVDGRRAALSRTHPDTLESMNNLAAVREAQRRWDEANELLVEVVETSRTVRGPKHQDTLSALNNLARLSSARGRPQDAVPLYRVAYETARDTLTADHPLTLTFRHNLGTAYFQAGDAKRAKAELAAVVAARRRVLPAGHADLIQSLHDTGVALTRTGEAAAAVGLLQEAYQFHLAKAGPAAPATVKAVLALAESLHLAKQPGSVDEADRLLAASIAAVRQAGPGSASRLTALTEARRRFGK